MKIKSLLGPEIIWVEIVGVLLFLVSPLLFIFQWLPDVWRIFIFLLGASGFVIGGGSGKRLQNLLFLIEVIVVVGGIYFVLKFNLTNILSELFKEPIYLVDNLVKICIVILWVLLFAFLYRAFFRADTSAALSYHFNRFYMAFISVLLILLLIIVLFKSFEFITAERLETIKQKNIPDYYVQIIGVLFAFIAVVVASGVYFIQNRVRKIEQLEDMTKELEGLITTSTDMIIESFPPFTVTQHVPESSFRILEELEKMIKSSPHISKFIEEKPERKAKILISRGIYFYAKDNVQSLDTLEKVRIMKRKLILVGQRTYGLSLWRLGIAYRQFSMFKKSIGIFEELRDSEIPEFRDLGKIGLTITNLAELRNSKAGSRFWGRRNNNLEEGIKEKLNESMKEMKGLWENGYQNFLIIWYLFNIAFELQSVDSQIFKEENFNFIKKELKTVILTCNDYSIKANYTISEAMLECIKAWRKDPLFLNNTSKIRDSKQKILDLREIARNFAERTPTYYPTIYSERFLRDVNKDKFIEVDINRFLSKKD